MEPMPTVHTVTTAGLRFAPQDLTIRVGDTVRFVMPGNHDALEVSQATYDARGTTPLADGFFVDRNETKEVVFSTAGIHYFVCTPHASLNMVGTITVE